MNNKIILAAIVLLLYAIEINYNPILSTVVILLLFILIVGFNFPNIILVTSIMLLAATLSGDGFSIPGLPSVIFMHKALILLGAGFYTLKNGLKKNITYLPLVSLSLCFIFSLIFPSKLPNYKNMDLVTAFFGLFLGWFIFYIDWRDKLKYIFYISIMPIFSLINGIILWLLNLWNPILHIDSYRLQGANIPPHLAMLGLVGLAGGLTLYYATAKKVYLFISFIDFFIIMATVTRGAIIGATIIVFLFIIDFAKSNFRKYNHLTLEVIIILLVFSMIILIFASQIIIRSTSSAGGVNTSGRLEAWKVYLDVGKNNRLFGLGLGAVKTIEGVDVNNSFTAAHNEYLRFFVETGFVGFILIFGSFVRVFAEIFKNNMLENKKYLLIGFTLAFIIFSATDNTISAVQFWVPFCWYLGLIYDNKVGEVVL